MYESGKIRPVQPFLTMDEGVKRNDGGREFN
jgi:hypothetical protein